MNPRSGTLLLPGVTGASQFARPSSEGSSRWLVDAVGGREEKEKPAGLKATRAAFGPLKGVPAGNRQPKVNLLAGLSFSSRRAVPAFRQSTILTPVTLKQGFFAGLPEDGGSGKDS